MWTKLKIWVSNHPFIITLIIVAILMVGVYQIMDYIEHPKTIIDNSAWQAPLDSMKKRDIIRTNEITILNNNLAANAIKMKQLQSTIDNYQSVITSINNKYEKINNRLITLPFNQRLQFFSDWLSKIDSTSK